MECDNKICGIKACFFFLRRDSFQDHYLINNPGGMYT